jgi:hypothetical protein
MQGRVVTKAAVGDAGDGEEHLILKLKRTMAKRQMRKKSHSRSRAMRRRVSRNNSSALS